MAGGKAIDRSVKVGFILRGRQRWVRPEVGDSGRTIYSGLIEKHEPENGHCNTISESK